MENKTKIPYQLTREGFSELIKGCEETLERNKDKLFDMYTSNTRCMDIRFRFVLDEVVTMYVNTEHNVKSNDEKYFVYY